LLAWEIFGLSSLTTSSTVLPSPVFFGRRDLLLPLYVLLIARIPQKKLTVKRRKMPQVSHIEGVMRKDSQQSLESADLSHCLSMLAWTHKLSLNRLKRAHFP
jgi:hypothetical protein